MPPIIGCDYKLTQQLDRYQVMWDMLSPPLLIAKLSHFRRVRCVYYQHAHPVSGLTAVTLIRHFELELAT